MEVRSEPGILSAKDAFTVTVPKSPTSSPSATVQNMRMAFGGDGMAVFRPVSGNSGPSSFQEGGVEFPTVQGPAMNPGEAVKRKRGRPKKYAPDGGMPLGLLSAPPSSSPAAVGPVSGSTGFYLSYASPSGTPVLQNSSSLQVKHMKKKGTSRPLSSAKKHLMNTIGSGGIGFTAHVITVQAGEDVSAKIMSFSHHGPRAVCILSANGAISNVTLRQAASSGGTVTYEGRFEILSLSGSFLLSESAGHRSRTGGLSVSLAGPDGRVMGGGVAGLLTAASPVQVVVGSFISDRKKAPQPISSIDVASAPAKVGPGGTPMPLSPHSGGTLSESSGGGGLDSPLNQSINGNNNNGNGNNNNGNGNQQGLPNVSWM